MSQTTYYALGDGHSALAMLLENLILSSNHTCKVYLVSNLFPESTNQKISYQPNSQIEIDTETYQNYYQENHSGKNFTPSIQQCFLGAMQPNAKEKIFNYFSLSPEYYCNIIPSSPITIIASTATIGYGLQIHPGVVVAPFACINNFATINRNSTIGHHTQIGEFTTINPGANIAGFTKIGASTIIGMGANILERLTIGHHVIVGAGAVVTQDLPDYAVAVGVPARIIRYQD